MQAEGVVHNGVIVVEGGISLPDGTRVTISTQNSNRLSGEADKTVTFPLVDSNWGEGIRRSAGIMAGDKEFEDVFKQLELERKSAVYRESGE